PSLVDVEWSRPHRVPTCQHTPSRLGDEGELAQRVPLPEPLGLLGEAVDKRKPPVLFERVRHETSLALRPVVSPRSELSPGAHHHLQAMPVDPGEGPLGPRSRPRPPEDREPVGPHLTAWSLIFLATVGPIFSTRASLSSLASLMDFRVVKPAE